MTSPPAPVQAPWRRRLPNALTMLRLVLAAGVFWLLASPPDRLTPARLIAAAVIFTLAAITDAADGYLARRWNVVSPFGRVMDPFADKILILGSFIMLAGPTLSALSLVAPWMAVLILARELFVTSIRGVYESRGFDFSADWSGKAKMILQSISVPAVLLLIALGSREPGSAARMTIGLLVWLTVAVTVLSGLTYVAKAIAAERTPPN